MLVPCVQPAAPARAQPAGAVAGPDHIVVEPFRGIAAAATRNHLLVGLGEHPLFSLLDADAARARARELFRSTNLSNEQYVQLPEEEKKEIETAVEALREAVNTEDHQAIRDAIERLNEKTVRVAELIMNAAIGRALKNKRVREIQ